MRRLVGCIERTIAGFALVAVAWLPMVCTAADTDPLAGSLRLLYAGDPVKAAALAEEYLNAHPDLAHGYVVLAQAKMAVGDFDTAYERLREAIRIDPENVDTLYHFGKLCTILAQREHQRLFQMAPDYYRVHQLMAESYLAQQDVIKAEEAYQAALKANPKSVTVLNAMGDLKRRELGGATERALDSPARSRYEQAILYYLRAVEIDPNSYEGHYGLGVSYLNSNQISKAIEHFRKAVQADPRSAVAYLGLGRSLLSAEKPADAVLELNTAVRLEPKLRQGFYLLGRAYQKLGKTDLARQALAKEQELRRAEFQAAQETMSAGGVSSRILVPETADKP